MNRWGRGIIFFISMPLIGAITTQKTTAPTKVPDPLIKDVYKVLENSIINAPDIQQLTELWNKIHTRSSFPKNIKKDLVYLISNRIQELLAPLAFNNVKLSSLNGALNAIVQSPSFSELLAERLWSNLYPNGQWKTIAANLIHSFLVNNEKLVTLGFEKDHDRSIVTIWDIGKLQAIAQFTVPKKLDHTSLVFTKDNNFLAGITNAQNLIVFNLQAKTMKTIPLVVNESSKLYPLSNQKIWVNTPLDDERIISIVNASTQTIDHSIKLDEVQANREIALSNVQPSIAILLPDSINLIDVEKDTLKSLKKKAESAFFTHNNSLALISTGGNIEIINPQTGKTLENPSLHLNAHAESLKNIHFHPTKNNLFLTEKQNNLVKIWDVKNHNKIFCTMDDKSALDDKINFNTDFIWTELAMNTGEAVQKQQEVEEQPIIWFLQWNDDSCRPFVTIELLEELLKDKLPLGRFPLIEFVETQYGSSRDNRFFAFHINEEPTIYILNIEAPKSLIKTAQELIPTMSLDQIALLCALAYEEDNDKIKLLSKNRSILPIMNMLR